MTKYREDWVALLIATDDCLRNPTPQNEAAYHKTFEAVRRREYQEVKAESLRTRRLLLGVVALLCIALLLIGVRLYWSERDSRIPVAGRGTPRTPQLTFTSPDGKYTISIKEDQKTVELSNAQTGSILHQFLSPEEIVDLVFSQDSKLILASSINNIVQIWDVVTGNKVGEFQLSNGYSLSKETLVPVVPRLSTPEMLSTMPAI